MQRFLATLGFLTATFFVVVAFAQYESPVVPTRSINGLTNTTQQQGSGASNVNASTPSSVDIVLDRTLVTLHQTQGDCWLIISGNVYNVTSYLSRHPGGVAIVVPYCGGDATAAFQTKGGRGESHSGIAVSDLQPLRIGPLGMVLQEGATVNTSVNGTPTNVTEVTTTPIVSPTAPATQIIALTMSTVAEHATVNDCWIVVNGGVYAVSSYVRSHPGGVSIIAARCGQDATTAFSTRGGTGSHSGNAYALLAGYRIGTLGQSVPVGSTQPSVTAPATSADESEDAEDNNEEEAEDEEEDDDDD